jgi:hypothetical protein
MCNSSKCELFSSGVFACSVRTVEGSYLPPCTFLRCGCGTLLHPVCRTGTASNHSIHLYASSVGHPLFVLYSSKPTIHLSHPLCVPCASSRPLRIHLFILVASSFHPCIHPSLHPLINTSLDCSSTAPGLPLESLDCSSCSSLLNCPSTAPRLLLDCSSSAPRLLLDCPSTVPQLLHGPPPRPPHNQSFFSSLSSNLFGS